MLSVTVVIPAFNAELYIERTLMSAINQTYDNLNILVVNDGSTDRTWDICDSISKRYPNVTVVSIPNSGVAIARNEGTKISKSYFVAYLDSDDIWHPTKIERQVSSLLQHGQHSDWVGVYTLFRTIDQHDYVIFNGLQMCPRGGFFCEHLLRNYVGNGSSLLVRRDAALAVGGFDPSYAARGIGGCEDLDFQLRLLQKFKIELVRDYLVGYRHYPGNMSSNHIAMGRGLIAVIEKFVSDSRVSTGQRDVARLTAHANAIVRFIRAHEWKQVSQSAGVMFEIDPWRATVLIIGLIFRVPRKLFMRIAKTLRDSEKRLKSRSRQFYEFEPDEGISNVNESRTWVVR